MADMGFIGVEWMTPARGAKSAHVEVPLNWRIPKLIWWFESILAMFVFWDSHLMSWRRMEGWAVFAVNSSISAWLYTLGCCSVVPVAGF